MHQRKKSVGFSSGSESEQEDENPFADVVRRHKESNMNLINQADNITLQNTRASN